MNLMFYLGLGSGLALYFAARKIRTGERFEPYFDVYSLGAWPFLIINWLMSHHKLELLPLAVQWVLVVVVFVGALFMAGIFVRPALRSHWVMPARGRRWGSFFVLALNTGVVAYIVTCAFAVVSTFLYRQGWATTSAGHPLTDPANDSIGYYVWNFLHSIPVLELPQALGWDDPPFRYTDQVNRLLLLVYKVVLISPVIATIALLWREVRTSKRAQKS